MNAFGRLLSWVKNHPESARAKPKRVPARRPGYRLSLEELESRLTPATFGVNTALDDTEADAFLTLREAITLVNAGNSSGLGRALTTEESAQITGIYGVNDTVTAGTVRLASVLPTLTANVRITGARIEAVNQAPPDFGFFHVGSGVTATFVDMNLFGAHTSAAGGAIVNDGILTLEDCYITSNGSTTLNVNGGAIGNNGTLTVVRSYFVSNVGLKGGAIYNTGTATLVNCTLLANRAREDGGAIYNEVGATLHVYNCTIALGNRSGEGQATTGAGGGIFNAGTTNIANTIVHGNFSDLPGANVAGNFNSLGHNLLGTQTGSTGWVSSDIVGDPLFGPTVSNGNQTPVLSLQANSPAIDAGNNAVVTTALYGNPTWDQRKLPRIADGDNNGTATVDIGAYEFQKYVITNGNDSGAGSLRDAVQQQNSFGLGLTIMDPSVQTITLTTGTITINVADFTLIGPTTNGVTIRQTVTFGSIFSINSSRVALANLTFANGNAGTGGAINVRPSASLTLDSCTLTGNDAGQGGAIYVDTSGIATLTNCTLANNDASSAGGAVYNQGRITLINCTLAENSAPIGGGIFTQKVFTPGNGGPIQIGGFTTIRNTIVAKNAGGDIDGSLVDSTFNLVGYGTNLAGISNGTNGNRVGTSGAPLDPLLTGLIDNGGPTFTMALLPGSLAIDAGTTGAGIPTDDQRGSLRDARPDLGAFEFRDLTLALLGDFNGDGKQDYAGFAPDGAWLVGLSSGASFITTKWAAWSATGWANFGIGDFNADGKDDIAGFGTNGTWWVGLSDGAAAFNTSLWATWSTGWVSIQFADFNGDGKDDVAGFGSNGTWWVGLSNGSTLNTSLWASWSTNWLSFQIADYNGDGKADVAGFGPNGTWWVGLSNGVTFNTSLWATWSTSWVSFQIGDYNGDGKADIAGFGSNGTWWVGLSNGINAFNTSLWATWSTGWLALKVGDFDGDGKTDIAGFGSNGTWWVGLSNGTSFNTTLWASWWYDLRFILVGDFTGDGKADVAGFYPIGTWWAGVSNGASFTTTLWEA